jgi:peptidoglycan/LPS O-acetylase OafA/YrhL
MAPDAEVHSDSISHPLTAATEVPDAVSPPPGNPRFPAVDGLRALAALSVVLFHAEQFSGYTGVLGRIMGHLDVGVAVFFAITGFLLYRPYYASAVGQAPRIPTRVFYWRRLLRIVPAYWVALIVLSPLLIFAKPDGLANIFFVQIYRPRWSRSGIGPAWSVCVEMSFYLLLPWFALALQRVWGRLPRRDRARRELALLLGLFVASCVARVVIQHVAHHPYLVDPLPTTLAWFCGGMALAIISTSPSGRAARFIRKYPGYLWLVGAALYAATLESHGTVETEGLGIFVAYAAIAVLILAPIVLAAPHFRGIRLFLTRPAAYLGLVSYGIYLYHYPLLQHLHPHGSPLARLGQLAVFGIAAAVVCGSLSYFIIEKPALRLKRLGDFPRLRRALDPGGQ